MILHETLSEEKERTQKVNIPREDWPHAWHIPEKGRQPKTDDYDGLVMIDDDEGSSRLYTL